tara:strand:- start:44998 stop:46017 length:1020 start_codon:yes stop_codon:yes gene_type:complete
MTDIKTGLWQSVHDGKHIKVRGVNHTITSMVDCSDEGCAKVYGLLIEDLLSDYKLIESDAKRDRLAQVKQSSGISKTLARHGSLDEYVDSLPAYGSQPVVDDTFNDDTVAQTFGPIEWDMGTQDKIAETCVCLTCKSIIPLDSVEFDMINRGLGCPTCKANASKMRLIGIAGPARAGKDTLASYMLDNLGDNWTRSSFADPIKKMLEVIGVDCSDDAKAVIDERFCYTPRHMMQILGTEWGREMIHGNIWVEAFARLNAGKYVIVPDVRFENEADLVREHGVLIHLTGRGGIEGNHVSENPIEFKAGDIVIDNSRDLDWLHAQVDGNAVLGEFIEEVGE